ncbi:MAG: restriction endonuclease subunit S [Candidatus Kapabacteria bacterium]|nr:restriction endonuclease subunit S [Candidatus Kapabacteria bacterium]
MIKIVENATYSEVKNSNRFDSKYYFLGEILNKTLSRFETHPISYFSKSIRKGIFDLNSKLYQTTGIPFIRISNLMSYTLDERGMVYIPLKNHKKESKTILVPGDLALSKIGKYLGKIAQVPLRFEEVNISQNIIGVAFDCEDYLRKYVFLYLTTPLAINQILRVSKQHNQNKLTLPDIRELKIPLLSDERMKYYAKEVNELSVLEDDSYKLVKKAQDFFYEKLNINFKEIKKEFSFTTSLKEVKAESFFSPEFANPLYNKTIKALNKFETKPLSELVKPYKGSEVGSENYNLYTDKIESDIPFIRTSDIVNYEVDNYPDFFITDEIYQGLNQEIKPLDIIFSKDGSIGNVAMLTEADKVIIGSGFLILRTIEEQEVSPYYIFCALSIPEIGDYQAKKRTVIASTIPHLRPENLLKTRIPILPKEDRDIISEILKEAFDKKSLRKHKLDTIKKQLELEFEAVKTTR